MEFQIKEIFLWIGGGLIAVVGWVASESLRGFLSHALTEFKRFTGTIEALVIQMAESNVRVNSHEKRIDRIETKLEELL